jgi:hypothetical protein
MMEAAVVMVAAWWRAVRGANLAAPLLVVTVLLLGGCAASVGTQTGGTDFRNTYNYLPVNDQPPEREQPLMSSEEQAKAREALTAARDHQTPRTVKRDKK